MILLSSRFSPNTNCFPFVIWALSFSKWTSVHDCGIWGSRFHLVWYSDDLAEWKVGSFSQTMKDMHLFAYSNITWYILTVPKWLTNCYYAIICWVVRRNKLVLSRWNKSKRKGSRWNGSRQTGNIFFSSVQSNFVWNVSGLRDHFLHINWTENFHTCATNFRYH